MKNNIRPVFTLFAMLTLITGVLYPLAVTGIAQVVFPFQANGSLIIDNGNLLGSKLIGQNFTGMQYFWGRPSVTAGSPYNAFDPNNLTGSSGSNLGPLSNLLVDAVQARTQALRDANPSNPLPIPVDLVTASATGLDPHISVAAANYQVDRVARARGISNEEVVALVDQYSEARLFGFLGEPRVNVLLLNMALDEIQ